MGQSRNVLKNENCKTCQTRHFGGGSETEASMGRVGRRAEVTARWLQARRAGTCGWRSSGSRARSTCTAASCAGRWWRTSATTTTCTSPAGSSARCAAPPTRDPTTCARTASSSTPPTTRTRASSNRPRRPTRPSSTACTSTPVSTDPSGPASKLCELGPRTFPT